jgi:hypothetical protein
LLVVNLVEHLLCGIKLIDECKLIHFKMWDSLRTGTLLPSSWFRTLRRSILSLGLPTRQANLTYALFEWCKALAVLRESRTIYLKSVVDDAQFWIT